MTSTDAHDEDDDLLFADEEPDGAGEQAAHRLPWRVLIVDDDREVHAVSRLALSSMTVEGSPLEILSAYSGREAERVISENPDIALMLLDVVMESDDAGLRVARFVRRQQRNQAVRVVLRTGQPGMAPERQVIQDYDINDYWSKTELTADRLRTIITGGIRSFRDIHTIERHREGLAQVIDATAKLFAPRALDQLIEATLTQLSAILKPGASALFFRACADDDEGEAGEIEVAAGTGRYAAAVGKRVGAVLAPEVLADIAASLSTGELVVTPSHGVYAFRRADAGAARPSAGIFMEDIGEPSEWDRNIIGLFCVNASISFANQRHYERVVALNRSATRFVPHEFLRLLGHRSLLTIDRGIHVQREMSVLFSDIRGFTSLIEGYTPFESFAFINEYIELMEPEIRANMGFIDGFEGDSIMALFEGSADDAVRAGVACQRALARYNAASRSRARAPLSIGVGVNTGRLMLGSIGNDQRLKCGVIGDPVNLASRVEGMTKLYGAAMLVTEFTHARLAAPDAWTMRVVGRDQVKGKSEPVTVYEVLDALDDARREARTRTRAAFESAWGLFRDGDMTGALAGFSGVLDADPSDRAARLYVDRCRAYLASGVPDGWNGTETLQEK